MKKLLGLVLLGELLTGIPVKAQDANAAAAATSPPAVERPLGPQSFHDRFMAYSIAAVGPRAFFPPALLALTRMADPPGQYPTSWRTGLGSLSHNYGNVLASGSALETAKFLTAAALHEDFRYRRSSRKNPLLRGLHAIGFTLVDKSDSGHNQLAVANFVGAAAGGVVGDLYLPPTFKGVTHTETDILLAFTGLATRNVLREFAPEFERLGRKLPAWVTHSSIPDWWVKR